MKPTLPHISVEFVEYIVEPGHLLELVIEVMRILDLLVPLVALSQHSLDVVFPYVKDVQKLLSVLSLFLKIALHLFSVASANVRKKRITVPGRLSEDGARQCKREILCTDAQSRLSMSLWLQGGIVELL